MYKRTVLLVGFLMIGLFFAQESINFYGVYIPVNEKISDIMSFSTKTSGNDPSSPSILSTAGSQTKVYVDAKDYFNCKTGELNITVPDGIIGGKIGLFDEAPPYLDMVIAPIEGNTAKFIVLASSTYSLVPKDFPSYVQLNDFKKQFILCPEQTVIPIEEVTENKSIEPLPAEVPKQTPPVVTKSEAIFAISVANESISISLKENKEVSAAQAKLAEANFVLNSGDYEQAKKLAEEAFELAKNAKAKSSTTTQTTTTVKTETKQQIGMDVTQLILIIVGAFVLILVYMILSERKTRVTKKK